MFMRNVWIPVIFIAVVTLAAAVVLFDNGPADHDGYLYAVYTDPEKNLDVVDVYESHYEGGATTTLSQIYRTAEGMNQFWTFDKETGIGPFDAYYAAINLSDDLDLYASDDDAEKRLSGSAGRQAR